MGKQDLNEPWYAVRDKSDLLLNIGVKRTDLKWPPNNHRYTINNSEITCTQKSYIIKSKKTDGYVGLIHEEAFKSLNESFLFSPIEGAIPMLESHAIVICAYFNKLFPNQRLSVERCDEELSTLLLANNMPEPNTPFYHEARGVEAMKLFDEMLPELVKLYGADVSVYEQQGLILLNFDGDSELDTEKLYRSLFDMGNDNLDYDLDIKIDALYGEDTRESVSKVIELLIGNGLKHWDRIFSSAEKQYSEYLDSLIAN